MLSDIEYEIERRVAIFNYLNDHEQGIKSVNNAFINVRNKIATLDDEFIETGSVIYDIEEFVDKSDANAEMVKTMFNKEASLVLEKYYSNVYGFGKLACYYVKQGDDDIEVPDIMLLTEEDAYSFLAHIVRIDKYGKTFDFLKSLDLLPIFKALELNSHEIEKLVNFSETNYIFYKLGDLSDESHGATDYIKKFFEEFFKKYESSITIEKLLSNIAHHFSYNNCYRCVKYTNDVNETFYIYPIEE